MPEINDKYNRLRKKAEQLREKGEVDIGKLTPDEIKAYVHELNVHKIELDLQNDELRRIQQELEEAKQKYFHLFEFAPIGYLSLDMKNRILSCNFTAALMLESEKESLLGKEIIKFLHPDSQDEFYLFQRTVLDKNENGSCELRVKQKNSGFFWGLLEFKQIRTSDKDIQYVSLININRRKKAERELEANKKKYQTIFESISDIYFQVDMNKNLVLMSPSGAKALGYDNIDELIGKSVTDTFCLQEKSCDIMLDRLFQYGSVKNHRIELSTLSGEIIHAEVNAALMKDEHGKPSGIEGIMRDVTEKVFTERKLKQSEKDYRSLINQLPIGIYRSTSDGKILHANQSLAEMLAYDSAEEMKNISSKELFFDINEREAELEEWNKNKGVVTTEIRLKKKNGSIIYARDRGRAILNEQGEIIYYDGIIEDISDKVKAEQARRETEEKYRLIFENAPMGIIFYDTEGYVTVCNEAHLQILGTERKNVIGFNVFQNVKNKKMVEEMKKPFQGQQGHYEGEYTSHTGKRSHYNRSRFEPVKESDGNIIGAVGIVEDLTEQVTASRMITKLSKGVEQSANLIVITDLDGNIEYVNQTFTKITGYQADEVIGENPRILKSGIHSDAFYKELWNTISSGRDWRGEICNKKKNGDLYWESMTISPVTDENNNILNYIAIKEDITEKRKIRMSLIESESRLSALIDSMDDYIHVIDRDFNIILMNNALKEFTEELGNESKPEGKNLFDYFSQQDERLKKEYQEVFKTGRILISEESREYNKKMIHSETRKIPVETGGEIIYVITLIRDISERKHSQMELIEAKEKAEEASRLKSIILGNLNHELRTPLNGIMGSAQLLKMCLVNEDDLELVDMQLQSAERLYKTLNNLLTLSELESHTSNIRVATLSIHKLLGYSIKAYEDEIQRKGLFLDMEIEDKNLKVQVDEIILNQIISNLLDNAIKFTKEGTIKITVSKFVSKNETLAVFKISDTGIGIENTKLQTIFEAFRQGSEGLARTHEGTGLGLSVTKKMVELLGGVIDIESRKGIGTTVTFTLPGYIEENDIQ